MSNVFWKKPKPGSKDSVKVSCICGKKHQDIVAVMVSVHNYSVTYANNAWKNTLRVARSKR